MLQKRQILVVFRPLLSNGGEPGNQNKKSTTRGQGGRSYQVSSKSVHWFGRYEANRQTNKQAGRILAHWLLGITRMYKNLMTPFDSTDEPFQTRYHKLGKSIKIGKKRTKNIKEMNIIFTHQALSHNVTQARIRRRFRMSMWKTGIFSDTGSGIPYWVTSLNSTRRDL